MSISRTTKEIEMQATGTHSYEDTTHNHAFTCENIFRNAYTKAIDADPRPAVAIAAAWQAHDEGVAWAYENVPLN